VQGAGAWDPDGRRLVEIREALAELVRERVGDPTPSAA
jgi:hypothetical protein